MNAQEFSIGSGGCQYIAGAGPHVVRTGYRAKSATIWADLTQIASITPCDSKGVAMPPAVTNQTWEGIAMTDGRYISFADPKNEYDAISGITLNAAGDKMMLWLEPI